MGRSFLFVAVLLPLFSCLSLKSFAGNSDTVKISNNEFVIKAQKYGLSELKRTNDIYPTNYISRRGQLGDVTVRYIYNKKLDSLRASVNGSTEIFKDGEPVYSWSIADEDQKALKLEQDFLLEEGQLVWRIKLTNTAKSAIRIEDLVVPVAYQRPYGENPQKIFEMSAIKHHHIAGDNSFFYFERPTGVAPYLLMVPQQSTSLEYWTTASHVRAERGTFKAFIHSSYTGNREQRGAWRQYHTSELVAPNETRSYGFKFRWADNYDQIRDILVEEGLIDVEVMPGMTVPTDLSAKIALRTKQPINSIEPEFGGGETNIKFLGKKKDDTNIYEIKFKHLGENKLVINYGDNLKTQLEFFVTEPLETLYKKRAAFIVNRQQHRDSTKWYDGLFGVYDMKNAELRGPDNADYLDTSRLSYILTCDDPSLCKAPFLASKNVVYPNKEEIEAVEYYIENFVWGGLQRTDQEEPYPYGVYGAPNWLVNRNQRAREAKTEDPYRFKMHVWRSYDYPHIMMMYYHMYQIASMYPQLTKFRDADGYLKLATETAKAYFIYPYEILPWYETYKWGCYNELLIPELIEVLEEKSFEEDASFLRNEWEKKVKYFIYDDEYPFRSEYAVDATAFESSYALAKYGVLNEMEPDSNLWFDKNLKRWYSHPVIRKEDAVDFMVRQNEANIAQRGSIEPAYYFLGSDYRGRSDKYVLDYMAQMGGWSILDYGLYFSDSPGADIRLGYQSYLSSFALINSGTPETNYGFWFPGKENDGASGWAFEPQKYTRNWMQKTQGRGPWSYDGEIDLGYCGALRTAATVVSNDEVFGMVAYGGELQKDGEKYSVIPKDGLRQKLYFRDNDRKFDVILKQDGFQKDQAIQFNKDGESIEFLVENRSGEAHQLSVEINGLKGDYLVEAGENWSETVFLDENAVLSLPVSGDTSSLIKLSRKPR
ncbi:DUF5695 domain-containing protein [Maribellus mangrovi]|uniref:DUF5695 domain-containing protein n=1 Tax=Maribellus mangrovi TaxID=3133146 RepID=UPI0030EB6E20